MDGNSTIQEYRGIENLVYARVTKDTAEAYETGEVKELAGVATLSKTTESNRETHYYSNRPAIVIDAAGSDELSIEASALPLEVVADVTGQFYENGILIEGEREPVYIAVGYRTFKTDGTEVVVWRYKCMASVPDEEHITKDDGTDANGQTLVLTSIATEHVFEYGARAAKSMVIDTSLEAVNVTDFFAKVTTPDSKVSAV